MRERRMFALTRETEGPFDEVVGYGLALPDGSAYCVAGRRPTGPPSTRPIPPSSAPNRAAPT
jgi:hypothetical protein